MAEVIKDIPETGTVTVGCRLPLGLHLDFHQKVGDLPGGGSSYVRSGRITLKGANSARALRDAPMLLGQVGITKGVDAQAFGAWMKANADHPAVKGGMIFCAAKEADFRAKQREAAQIKSGLDPLDPDKPGPGVTRIDPKKEKDE